MHAAPSVTYPVGRSRSAGALLLAAWLTGLATCLVWWAQVQAPGWRIALAAFSLALTGAAALRQWWRSPAGALAWDGTAWNWSARGQTQTASLEVALDLQRQMLVRCQYGGAAHWLWLERSRDAHRWDDVRRAVYSRARPDALQQTVPPAAKP